MEDNADRVPASTFAEPARTGEPSADSSMVNRYQRRLLYGGGALVSIILAIATGVLLYAMARDEVARRYTDFAVRKLLVQLEFQAREFAVLTFIHHEEAVWSTRASADPALINTFAAQHGRIELHGNPQFYPVLALGDLAPHASPDAFGRYLALANELSYRAGAYFKLQAQSQAMSGYLYSPDQRFIVFIPAPEPGSAALASEAADVPRLIETLAPPASSLHRLMATDSSNGPIWLAPARDPIQKQRVIRLVAAAFDDGKPFAILVSNLPTQSLLMRLPADQYDNASLLLDNDGQVMLSTRQNESAHPVIDQVLRARPTLHSQQAVPMFRDGLFVISQGIRGTGWTLVHAFSWRTLVVALWPKLTASIATLLLVLGLIWSALVWLDRKVFRPALQRTQRMMESENLNRTMITTAPFGFALVGFHDKAVLLQNDVMRAYDRQMQGDEPLHRKLLCLLDPAPSAPAWQHDLETTLAMRDGSRSDLLVSLMRTRYQGNDVVLCNFTDITTRKHTERKLEEARRAADAANEAKSVFVHTMSHEIRTPLNAILGNLELLDRSPLSPEQSERLGTVTSSSYALLDMISSVLDFSKIESGQMPIEAIRFDLAGLIRQIGAMFAPIIEAKGIQFDCVIDDALAPRYLGDPTRIRQIVTNLLSNAVKFTAQGDITLEVYLDDSAAVVIGVSDTGGGIAPAQQRQLFQAFTQADASIARRYGGTGLGLALCKRLVVLMHGTIAVKSEPGIGSTFIVTLPLEVATVAEQVADSPQEKAAPLDNARAIRILVVDDHPANRVLIREQLKTLGYEVDLADEGGQALQRFDQNRYDVVMTDLHMPGMDGYSLARNLRAQGASVPIIAITATASTSEHEQCVAAGMDAVLVKPMLLDTIDRMMRRFVSAASLRKHVADLAYGPLPANVHALMQQTLQQSLASMRAALDKRDLAYMRDHLHALRGSFAMIREMDTAERARQMEAQADAGDHEALKAAMQAFAEHATSVLERRAAMPADT